MELLNNDPSNSRICELIQNKIFRVNVNFVYEELLNQFLNNNGECKLGKYFIIKEDRYLRVILKF
jgi:hypothetical protein